MTKRVKRSEYLDDGVTLGLPYGWTGYQPDALPPALDQATVVSPCFYCAGRRRPEDAGRFNRSVGYGGANDAQTAGGGSYWFGPLLESGWRNPCNATL